MHRLIGRLREGCPTGSLREDIVALAVRAVGDESARERCAENSLPIEEEEEIVGNFYFERAKWGQFVPSGPGATCLGCGSDSASERMEKAVTRYPKHIWSGVKALRAIVQELSGGKSAAGEVMTSNPLSAEGSRTPLTKETLPVEAMLRILEIREGCPRCFRSPGKGLTRYSGAITIRVPMRVSKGDTNSDVVSYWDITREFELPLKDPPGCGSLG